MKPGIRRNSTGIDDYIQQMSNPREKLRLIRIFLKNIGWDDEMGTTVFISRLKNKNGKNASVEEERERTLQYFYDQDEPREEKALVALKSPKEKGTKNYR